MNVRSFKRIIGQGLYKTIGAILPAAHCRIGWLGRFAKWFRGGVCAPLMCEKVGKNVNVYKKAQISPKVQLGDNSDIGFGAKLFGEVIIGSDVIMAPDVVIYTRNHKFDSLDIPIKYQGSTEERRVVIQDGCWIGHGVLILPGVTIGKGAVCGARAVITKDVPPFAVVGGNPARVIKYRNK